MAKKFYTSEEILRQIRSNLNETGEPKSKVSFIDRIKNLYNSLKNFVLKRKKVLGAIITGAISAIVTKKLLDKYWKDIPYPILDKIWKMAQKGAFSHLDSTIKVLYQQVTKEQYKAGGQTESFYFYDPTDDIFFEASNSKPLGNINIKELGEKSSQEILRIIIYNNIKTSVEKALGSKDPEDVKYKSYLKAFLDVITKDREIINSIIDQQILAHMNK